MKPEEIRTAILDARANYAKREPSIKPKPDPAYERVDLAAEVLNQESDRGFVIFAASLVGDSLTRLIKSRLRDDEASRNTVIDPLFSGLGPLATFSAQIKLAYAMKLIAKEGYEALELLRKMRNEFAHSPSSMQITHDAVFQKYLAFVNLAGFSGKPLMDYDGGERLPLMLTLIALEAHLKLCADKGEAVDWIRM